MKFIPVKTKIISPPQEDIYPILDKLSSIKEKDIIFITSKIVAIHQGRTVAKKSVNKNKLIQKEADVVIPSLNFSSHTPHPQTPSPCKGEGEPKHTPLLYKERGGEAKRSRGEVYEAILTIKNNTFIPQAGIDESNAGDYYILWPSNPYKQAKEICEYLKKKFGIKKMGVVITDSHLTPFRWGTSGISIGFYGINPLSDYRGAKDIFGRKMQMTQVNIVDSISAMAVLHMGEGNNKTPIVIGQGFDFVEFVNKEKCKDFIISREEDIFNSIISEYLLTQRAYR